MHSQTNMFFGHFKFHHHLAEPAFPVFVFLIEMSFKRWSSLFLVPSRIPVAIDHVRSGRNFLSTDPADVDILTDLCWMHVGDVSPDLTEHPPTPGTLHWLGFLSSVCRVHVLHQTVVRLLISESNTNMLVLLRIYYRHSAVLCHKEPARSKQSHLLPAPRWFFMA